jgi:hypothetical protein
VRNELERADALYDPKVEDFLDHPRIGGSAMKTLNREPVGIGTPSPFERDHANPSYEMPTG